MDANTTALQNLVVATNSVARVINYSIGGLTSVTFSGPVTASITTGSARLVRVSVVVGPGVVQFYNSASISSTPATALLYTLDPAATIGVTDIGLQASEGIVMVLGAGVSANCTYSVG